MAQLETSSTVYTHSVHLNGEVVPCTVDTFEDVCDQLIARHGGGQPKVTRMEPPAPAPAPAPAPVVARIMGSGIVTRPRNTARAILDEEIARANGFMPRDPMYSVGTAVNQTGVANAARSQREHAAKPLARDMCRELIQQVQAEQRADLQPVRVAHLRMTKIGELALPDSHQVEAGARLPITETIFTALMTRFPCRKPGAYLADCPTELRAINFNHWAKYLGEQELGAGEKAREVVLRTRLMNGRRAAYAAVSGKYTAYDADKIAQALVMAFPADARGSLDYDGERMRVEGLWHSDVAPQDYVAGEIFKAGVLVDTDDTGGGSLRVRSVLWRNLCLNLIILDKAIGVDIRIRHQGSVQALAHSFRDAFGAALGSVEAFRAAWSYARAEQGAALVQRVQGTTSESLGSLPIEAVLPGIFTGVIKRELVPVRGRVQDTVPKLLELHRQDERAEAYGVSRASVVNAFTRYAHQVETDPFHADAIRAGAGALLSGHRGNAPAPLPYVSSHA